MKSWMVLVSAIWVILYSPVLAQEIKKPLSLEEVEDLVRGGVSAKRVVTIVEERGISFDVTAEVRDRLRKVGVESEILTAIERAGAEFFRRQAEAEKKKAEEEKRKLEAERQRSEAERALVEERKKLEAERQALEEQRKRFKGLQRPEGRTSVLPQRAQSELIGAALISLRKAIRRFTEGKFGGQYATEITPDYIKIEWLCTKGLFQPVCFHLGGKITIYFKNFKEADFGEIRALLQTAYTGQLCFPRDDLLFETEPTRQRLVRAGWNDVCFNIQTDSREELNMARDSLRVLAASNLPEVRCETVTPFTGSLNPC